VFTQSRAEPAPLDPRAYTSTEAFDAEQPVLREGWHLVAVQQQLARPGDFVATDVSGVPVLVRNHEGTVRAWLNVCAHRHSLLEAPGCGRRDRLRCQYHGWEYAADGRLAKLPDGPSFPGFKAPAAALTCLPVECFGALVFVRLGEGPPLREQLGALADELTAAYARPLELLWARVQTFEVNWKVIVENAIESYHVPLVHPNTFARYRAPELHDHLLAPTFTRYRDLEPWSTTWQGRALGSFARVLLPERSDRRNTHAHLFPNTLLYFGDLYCDAVVLTPLSPRSTRVSSFAFMPSAFRSRLLKPAGWAWARFIDRTVERINSEDRSSWAWVQAGLDTRPTRRATLGAREERITAFQRWLVEQLAQKRARQPAHE